MSIPKKVRSDAVLRQLPRPRQDALIEYMEVARIEEVVKRKHADGTTEEFTRLRCPTLVETLDWLARDGVVTSTGALSQFRSSYLLQQQMEANEAVATELVEEGKQQGWLRTSQEEQAAGQAFFSRLAIAQQDPKVWASQQKIELAREKLAQEKAALDLARDKFQFDAASAALKVLPQLKAIAGDKSLDENAKINAVRAKLFGTLPA